MKIDPVLDLPIAAAVFFTVEVSLTITVNVSLTATSASRSTTVTSPELLLIDTLSWERRRKKNKDIYKDKYTASISKEIKNL